MNNKCRPLLSSYVLSCVLILVASSFADLSVRVCVCACCAMSLFSYFSAISMASMTAPFRNSGVFGDGSEHCFFHTDSAQCLCLFPLFMMDAMSNLIM